LALAFRDPLFHLVSRLAALQPAIDLIPQETLALLGKRLLPVLDSHQGKIRKKGAVLAGARPDNGSRQRGQEQHEAHAKQDNVLEYEFSIQIPGHRVGRQAPFNDTRRRKEERPRDRKSDNSHQRAHGGQDWAECARYKKCGSAKLGNAKKIRFSPEAEHR
jgi:hypothetical protein